MKKILFIITGIIIIGGIVWAVYTWLPVSIWQEPPGSQITTQSPSGVAVETVADNLRAPWAIDFTETGDIFFTERPGRVRVIQDGELRKKPILTLPRAESEGGTLGLALDPNFSSNQYVYVYYTTAKPTNRISRYRFNGDALVEETVLVNKIPGAEFHNGGRIAFGPDGKLYAGTGDARTPASAQNKDSLAGKILRINPDGSKPVDNPDPNSFVYSYGHRNVQGLDWDPNGSLYATEHGPQAHDEVNEIEPGANYGWPAAEGSIELDSRTDAPVVNYRNPVKSSGSLTWAPSGAVFYDTDVLPESWRGTFIFAGLRSESLWQLDTATNQIKSIFKNEYGRLRTIQEGPNGRLYMLTSNRDGRGSPNPDDDKILRITPQ